MLKIMVANPKGGAGKSTMAIHLASWFATLGQTVYLGDTDRQQSSRQWLEIRPKQRASIRKWDVSEEDVRFPSKGCDVAILDTPAGLHGKRLKELLNEVDRVVVPVSPSRFDMLACKLFFEELAQLKSVRKERVGVGMVGMKVNPKTHASQQLLEYLQTFDLPLVACIPQGQRYVNAAESGETIFDANTRGNHDMPYWKPLLDWLAA